VTALLAFDIGIHFFHSSRHITTEVVALVLIIVLLYFRDEFYAEGDKRTRWRALWAFGWLVVADIAIGLSYIYFVNDLASDYSLWQRVQEVIYGLVGVSGQIYWVPEARGDLFNFLTSALGLFTLIVTAYLFLRPAEPRARQARRPRLARLLRPARRQERDLVAHRQGVRQLPGRLRRHAGER
jgi:lysyl-tRNA synthetase class 2